MNPPVDRRKRKRKRTNRSINDEICGTLFSFLFCIVRVYLKTCSWNVRESEGESERSNKFEIHQMFFSDRNPEEINFLVYCRLRKQKHLFTCQVSLSISKCSMKINHYASHRRFAQHDLISDRFVQFCIVVFLVFV